MPVLCLVLFCICPKTPFSVFTSQKISQMSRGSWCRPLSNGVKQKNYSDQKINSNINQNSIYLNLTGLKRFKKIFSLQNLQQYIIACWRWIMELADLTNSEKNRKRLENTTSPYSAPSTPSYSYDKLNEYSETSCKKYIHCRDTF